MQIRNQKIGGSNAKKGFHTACEDIKATHKFVVYSGADRFPMSGNTEAIGLIEFLKMLQTMT